MAKEQIIHATEEDGRAHVVRCTYRPLRRSLVICIDDGEAYVLPAGAREELFRLGDEQAILCVKRNGSVSIRTKSGEFTQ